MSVFQTLIFIILFIVSAASWAQTHEGVASFYSKKFNGRKTSSGEKFYADSLTAAHKWLPFGCVVKVTNLSTGDTVWVRINDRIAHKKRVLDVSPAAARKLGFYQKGTTKVKIEIIRMPNGK